MLEKSEGQCLWGLDHKFKLHKIGLLVASFACQGCKWSLKPAGEHCVLLMYHLLYSSHATFDVQEESILKVKRVNEEKIHTLEERIERKLEIANEKREAALQRKLENLKEHVSISKGLHALCPS